MTVRKPSYEAFCLALLLISSFLLKLHHLDHRALTYWDESFHAVVARNLLSHPLKPTLVDVPYLPNDHKDWTVTHIWLHKPILPLWQIALAYSVLGVNTLALRLPSALLSTGALWLTYGIGKNLLDSRAGVIAAALQAANPAIMSLVHGYLFSDHIDVALLFWVELGVYFLVRAMRTGSWCHVLLAGTTQGLAYLSKSYLAAIISGLAFTAWFLPVAGLMRREEFRLRIAHLLVLLGATLVTIAPWTLYSMVHYPQEFWHEHALVWKHLYSNVEIWRAPWDRLVFDYMVFLYDVFYTPVLVAGLVLWRQAFLQRHGGLVIVYAWAVGVLLPHVLAASKTPSATLIGMPPFFLLLGCLVSQGWRTQGWTLAAWFGIVAMSMLFPGAFKGWGVGYSDPPRFAGIMREALWVIWHVAGALGGVLLIAVAAHLWRAFFSAGLGRLKPMIQIGALGLAAAGTIILFFQAGVTAWRITEINRNEPTYADIAAFARKLPENAVLLFNGGEEGEYLLTMFLAKRTCYSLAGKNLDETAQAIQQRGGRAYIVSFQDLPLRVLYESKEDRRRIYEWAGTT